MTHSRKYRYLFGPVPSRRFGRSLGVDLVPLKTCPLNCRFCQLGPTLETRVCRRAYVAVDDVLRELADWVSSGTTSDFVTLAGSGEPTLHCDFGHVLRWVKDHTRYNSLLLSNGVLFTDPDVRMQATHASVVKVSLHAWDQASFEQIVRPHPSLRFREVVQSYRRFREQFAGRLLLEVFVIPGVNDAPGQVERIAELARSFSPDGIDLNTAVRPAPDAFVRPASRASLEGFACLFSPRATIPVGLPEEAGIELSDDALVGLLQRHPCSLGALSAFLGLDEHVLRQRMVALNNDARITYDEPSGCWTVPRSEGHT